MVSMAIPSQVGSQVCMRESIERKPWTSEAWNDVFGFFAQSLGFVCAAIFVYSLGPALGMALIAVSLAVWSLLRSQIASEEGEQLEEDGGHADSLNWPSRGADPVWMGSSRFGTSTAPAIRPAQRQGT